MKKLITLLMFSLIGITQTWAWSDMYLLNSEDDNWTSNLTIRPMTEVPNNDGTLFYYILDSSTLTKNDGTFYFRFYTSNDNGKYIGAHSANATLIGTTNYGCKWEESSNSFMITTDKSSRYIISLYYKYEDNANKFVANAALYNGDATIRLVNLGNFTTPYLYAYTDKDSKLLGNWPGTPMVANSDGTYSLELNDKIGAYTNIIFVDYTNSSVVSQYPANNDGGISVNGDGVFNNTSKSAVTSQSVGVGSTYAISTYSSEYPLDFSEVDGIQAYIVTGVSGDGTLTTVKVSKDGETAGKKVPANTGLLITADAVSTSVDVPTTVTTDDIDTNWLTPGTGTTVNQTESDGSINYILTRNTVNGDVDTPKFYKVNSNGNTIPTGKAYLQIPPSSPAPQFFNFDFDYSTPTSINMVNGAGFMVNGSVYNLNGQRVANPTKGLYIVNGRKVVLK